MKRRKGGFTLVELLVSMAVLVLIVVITAQIVSSIMQVIGLSTGHMDALTQTNVAMNRLDTDLQRALWRQDLLPYAGNNTGNDAFCLYSGVPAYSGDRPLSLVAYRVQVSGSGTGTSPVLQRGTIGSSWSAASPAPVTFLTGTTATDASTGIQPADWQTIAPAVFRMEVVFIDRNTGGFKSKPSSVNWSDVNGMLVTMAALDMQTRQMLGPNQATIMAKLALELKDFDGTVPVPVPVDAQWQQVALLNPKIDGMPPAVQGKLRIVQRLYQW